MFKVFVDSAMRPRNILTNFRQKVTFIKTKLPCHKYLKFESYRKILMTNLGLDHEAAGKVLFYQQHIFNIQQKDIVRQCQLCQKLYINPNTLFRNADLLHWKPHMLVHRVLLLRELGVCDLHAAMVSNYKATTSMRMGLFKAYTEIPKTSNVALNLLECLHKPPRQVRALAPLSDSLTVNDYRKECLRWYLKWRLDIPKDDVKTLSFLINSMKNRSFRVVRRLFDVLHDDIGLTIEQIRNYACLSRGSAEDLRRIITEIKTFAGIDFRALIRQHPELHAMQYRCVVTIIKLLRKHGFSTKAMRRCPEILLMDGEVVTARLKKMEKTPELRVLKNNVRALKLILKFSIVEIRLEYTRYLGIKYPTVRLLTGELQNFGRFVRTGVDHTKARELGFLLEKHLNLEPKEIIRKITKHPYWQHVDLVTVHDTVTYLLKRFKPHDLRDNLQLLLYPREKIAEVLESLLEENEKPDESQNFTPKQIVALCLYEIECEYHFSGDGVWKYDEESPRRSKVRRKQLDAESDSSDSEVAESETENEKESRKGEAKQN